MAHQRDPLGIAAKLGDMFMRPRDRRRAVLDKVGPMRLGHQPVIGGHHDKALPRQCPPGEAIAAALAAVPAAAVEENDHGEPVALLEAFGSPDVERLAGSAAIGLVGEQKPRAVALSEQPVRHVERLRAARDDHLGAAAEQQHEQQDHEENLDQSLSSGNRRVIFGALQGSGAANKPAAR